MDSGQINTHSYPVYKLDREEVKETDIDIDFSKGIIKNRISVAKNMIKKQIRSSDSDDVDKTDVVENIKAEGIDEETAEKAISKLERAGEVYEPSAGRIQFL
jgi:DNA replicative helicase MCM subunit Mcm2 (Cdc46/Mcm family)